MFDGLKSGRFVSDTQYLQFTNNMFFEKLGDKFESNLNFRFESGAGTARTYACGDQSGKLPDSMIGI